MRKAVLGEIATREERVDQRQARRGAITHRDRDRMIPRVSWQWSFLRAH